MNKEELLKKIDFEKSWLYDCGIFGSDVDIAFHAIKKSVIEALEQEPKTDTWSIKDVADTLEKHGLIAEQEPCEDCISRQAVIELCEGWWLGHTKEDDFATEVRALPSVNPQKSGWIPVSERLPEDNELVLFSTKTDRVFEGRFFSDNTDRQWYSFRDETFAWNNVVIAWMPLPEPYKVESEE